MATLASWSSNWVANAVPPPGNPAVSDMPATKPPKLTLARQEQFRRLAATGEPVRELAAAFGIARAIAYRCLAQ
jgi:hypothetical protein